MSMFGLKELAGENFWQRLPLFIWVLNIHSAQRADFGLPVSCLLAEKLKAGAHELIFIFSQAVWKHFLSCIFPPLPIFLVVIHFSFLYFSRRMADCNSFASAGFSHPHCLSPHGKKAALCAMIAPRGQIAPGPPASHFTGWDALETSGDRDALRMLWKLRRRKEKPNTH